MSVAGASKEAQEDSQSHAERFYAAAVCERGCCLKRLAGFSGLLRGIGVREIIDVGEYWQAQTIRVSRVSINPSENGVDDINKSAGF